MKKKITHVKNILSANQIWPDENNKQQRKNKMNNNYSNSNFDNIQNVDDYFFNLQYLTQDFFSNCDDFAAVSGYVPQLLTNF